MRNHMLWEAAWVLYVWDMSSQPQNQQRRGLGEHGSDILHQHEPSGTAWHPFRYSKAVETDC